ncbi:glycosyltransferase family 1 protein [Enterobacter cloacae]|uniref:glycosyltransferase family 4 protein n=1 Tax=Enterobacter cloacae TaxID=550 RepID=UPI000D34CB21|nr:glycosyltransferase family 4 protein [Enterobacter cloacae]QCC91564.1 glycosyltransferase family 1 protein [Enterobacter cloacae]QCC96564.1 glycosyltransferase family 1 protein [Enterobacter cloacae]QCD11501.1 glycosyltransferase family 1 protein [Enterobacter cloacae]
MKSNDDRILLYFVNVDWFFISHRLPIALKALADGYKVAIACHFTSHRDELESMGFMTYELPFSRSGVGLFSEIKTLLQVRKVIKLVKPSLIHSITIKPVIYSGLMRRTISSTFSMVSAISGLGYVFTTKSFRANLIRLTVTLLYKLALAGTNKIVIFQNSSDECILSNIVGLKEHEKVLIKGSGADLNVYGFKPEPDNGQVKIAMACRLLKDKGVYQYIEAARLVKKKHSNSEFLLIGSPDPENPNSVTDEEINIWVKEGVITYLGHRKDIANIFADSNIVSLPSFYGEGVPKVLIEAAACGRAIVTTNNPGCRDAIIDGETGICVPIKDSIALARAIASLIEQPTLRQSMGRSARVFAETEFDIESVVSKHMAIYNAFH